QGLLGRGGIGRVALQQDLGPDAVHLRFVPAMLGALQPGERLTEHEPRPQIAKPEPSAEEKKYSPRQFDALLNDLAPERMTKKAGKPPQTTRMSSASTSSEPKATTQLTASELAMVRQQVARCWNVPSGARDAKDLIVEIRIVV